MLAALSLSWPFIAGLGALPAAVMGGRARDEADNLRLLAAVWSFGLCLDYVLLQMFGRLAVVLAVGSSLALAIGLAALWRCRARLAWPRQPWPWLIALGVLVGVSIRILIDPLQDWDARTIWFFHGKMIFYGAGLDQAIGLDGPSVPHPAYPMLVPGLAAQVASVAGFWNEYLPKLSLALLLPVPILVVLMLRRTPVSMTLLILAFAMITNQFLYNGSMDGYLALYAAAAAFFLVDWLEGGGGAAFLAAAGALGVVGGLKTEGQIVYLALAAALAYLVMRRKVVLHRPSTAALVLAALPFAGFLLWHVLAARWLLRTDDFSFGHALPRLFDPSALWQIVHIGLLHSRFYVPVLALLAIMGLARFRGMALPATIQLPLIAGVLFIAGACLVFAMTPNDLLWQLNTAAGRVVRSGTEMLLVGAVLILRDLERRSARGGGARSDAMTTGRADDR